MSYAQKYFLYTALFIGIFSQAQAMVASDEETAAAYVTRITGKRPAVHIDLVPPNRQPLSFVEKEALFFQIKWGTETVHIKDAIFDDYLRDSLSYCIQKAGNMVRNLIFERCSFDALPTLKPFQKQFSGIGLDNVGFVIGEPLGTAAVDRQTTRKRSTHFSDSFSFFYGTAVHVEKFSAYESVTLDAHSIFTPIFAEIQPGTRSVTLKNIAFDTVSFQELFSFLKEAQPWSWVPGCRTTTVRDLNFEHCTVKDLASLSILETFQDYPRIGKIDVSFVMGPPNRIPLDGPLERSQKLVEALSRFPGFTVSTSVQNL